MSVFIGLLLPVVVASPLAAAGQRGPGSHWVEPVDGPVVDGFRPPAHIGAPGNRGWEYTTTVGSVVVAAGDGRVVFAGRIGASRYVSIDHRCGLRTTYSHVASVSVAVGDMVHAGQEIATAGERMHFGVRRGVDYLDPAGLFGSEGRPPPRPRLVPVTLR